jgi:FtsH-binding integral membrane protein
VQAGQARGGALTLVVAHEGAERCEIDGGRDVDRVERAHGTLCEGTAGVFGQVMGLVAITVGFFTLGAYLGRNFTSGPAIICFVLGFVSIIGLNFARRSEGLAITMLFAAGAFLGLGLGGGLRRYAEFEPSVIWQAAGATALFVAGLGSAGYAIRRDLSRYYRFLFFALFFLQLFGNRE